MHTTEIISFCICAMKKRLQQTSSQVVRNLLFIALCSCGISAHAKHIIGGDFTYECLENGQYAFKLTVYRDCRPQTDAAPLDAFATISIYERTPNGRTSLIANFSGDPSTGGTGIRLEGPDEVSPPIYPCFELPPNLCVEKGEYNFRYQFRDWPSNNTYIIIYQRCCRNNTISNLITPGDWGATFQIEISPKSQETCNNSPVFRNFPPTVLCSGQPFDFDHSAIDREGDSLVYTFSEPLHGGGQDGTQLSPGDPFSCTGVFPSPACPPPFRRVIFQAPFSATNPMPTDNSPIVINPRTGLITGTPSGLGQYVVNVLVEEYRSDTLIGSISRDFQFNLGDCLPEVFAGIQHEAVIGDQEFLIRGCGIENIDFINESTPVRDINTYYWAFDLPDGIITSSQRDISVSFPGIGDYRGTMILNPGLECSDTANIFVEIRPDLNADFNVIKDTCAHIPIEFENLSVTGAAAGMKSYQWDFGDGGVSLQKDPVHLYQVPGIYRVQLDIEDQNECTEQFVDSIFYYPRAEEIIARPNFYVSCKPATIVFSNESRPVNDEYSFEWDFGDAGTSTERDPSFTFEESGNYSVGLTIRSPLGCVNAETFSDLIRVQEGPAADFSATPEKLNQIDQTVYITDQSSNAKQLEYFIDGKRFTEPNPVYTFPDTGRYQILQVVLHENLCRDSLVKNVYVVPISTFKMPNAFSPNGDGLNDFFLGKGITSSMRFFEMTIWSRWGELLFETNNPEEGWDGMSKDKSKILPNGAYIYQVNYIDAEGEMVELKGFATIVK